ncbi:MAG: hypothetical protein J5824_04335 [Lachnospiraceae bacterium]|nr:hypothetical protein [Lachnospiraceae bacterium]
MKRKFRVIFAMLAVTICALCIAGCSKEVSSDGNSGEEGSGVSFLSNLFSKDYEVGKNPKIEEMYMVVYESGTFSSEYGEYVYDKYEAHDSHGDCYVEVDMFDIETAKQVKTKVVITEEECHEIFKILEGCKYVEKKKTDSGAMDGFMDSSSSRFDLGWYDSPGGNWYIESDSETRNSFIDAVKKAAGVTADGEFTFYVSR